MDRFFRSFGLEKTVVTSWISLWNFHNVSEGFSIKIDTQEKKAWFMVTIHAPTLPNTIFHELGAGVKLTHYADMGAENSLLAVEYEDSTLMTVIMPGVYYRVRFFITKDAPPAFKFLQPSEQTRAAFLLRKENVHNTENPAWKLDKILRTTPSENFNQIFRPMIESFRLRGVSTDIEEEHPLHPINAPMEKRLSLQDLVDSSEPLFHGATFTKTARLLVNFRSTVFRVLEQPRNNIFLFDDVDSTDKELFLSEFVNAVARLLEVRISPQYAKIIFSRRFALNIVPSRRDIFRGMFLSTQGAGAFFRWQYSVKAQATRQGIESLAQNVLQPLIWRIATKSSQLEMFDPSTIS